MVDDETLRSERKIIAILCFLQWVFREPRLNQAIGEIAACGNEEGPGTDGRIADLERQ